MNSIIDIEAEERFRATFEQAAIGIALVSLDGHWLRVNQKLCDIVGYSRDELQTKTFQDITHADDLDSDLAFVRQMLDGDIQHYSMDKRYTRKDGSLIWVNLTVALVRKADATPDYFISCVEDISAKKQSESELRKFKAIVDSSDDAIISKTLTGIITSWNMGAEKMFGYTAAETIGNSMQMLIPTQRQHEETEILERISKGERIVHFETVRRRKDGQLIDISTTISPILDNAGNPIGASKIARDISGRKQAEDALRRSEESYRSLFENLLDSVSHCRMIFADGKPVDMEYLTVNPSFEKITGLTKDVVGRRISEVIPGYSRDNPESIEMFGSVATSGVPRRWEHYLAALDQWYDFSLYSPVRGEVVIISTDITARKKAEKLIRENEEKLHIFIEHAPASLAMFDRDMRYLAVSKHWMSDYSLGDRDIMGYSHYEIFPEIQEGWKSVHRRALAGETVRADEDRFERADGTVQWLRWEVLPWRAGDGSVGGIVIFSEDITAYKQAEDEIRHLNAVLEQRVIERTAELTAANQELDSFAYAVSHDLRGPLSAMSGFSQALIEDFGNQLQGEAKVYMEQIDIAGHKMGELIDGILALSRSTRGELHRNPIDVTALATSLFEELARNEPERKVEWHVEAGLMATGDARMVEAVLRNLLGNAWKYTGKTAVPVIRVFSGELDGHKGFCVADNGAGFEMAHIVRLFKPFQRLHRQDEFPGLGIGLATVQRIIHRHGGSIRAEGKPGGGAIFCFTLSTNNRKESS